MGVEVPPGTVIAVSHPSNIRQVGVYTVLRNDLTFSRITDFKVPSISFSLSRLPLSRSMHHGFFLSHLTIKALSGAL